MQRILIVGQSGSGKSTLSCMLASGLKLPWFNGDQILRHPDCTLRSEKEFLQYLGEVSSQPRWVMDGNVIARNQDTLTKADTLIWLDYGMPLTAFRFASRSAARLRDGENVMGEPRKPHESFANIAKDIYWSTRAFIRRQTTLKDFFTPLFEGPAQAPHLQKIRLRSPAETAAFLQKLEIAPTPTPTQKREARRTLPATR